MDIAIDISSVPNTALDGADSPIRSMMSPAFLPGGTVASGCAKCAACSACGVCAVCGPTIAFLSTATIATAGAIGISG